MALSGHSEFDDGAARRKLYPDRMIATYLEYVTIAFVVFFLLAWTATAFIARDRRLYFFALGCIAVAGAAQLFLFLYR